MKIKLNILYYKINEWLNKLIKKYIKIIKVKILLLND